MAATTVGRICGAGLLRPSNGVIWQRTNTFSTANGMSAGQKRLLTSLGLLTGGAGALILALEQSVQASGAEVHPTPLPWWHKDFTHTYDHASLRRGYEVYKNVCAACHSMRYIAYRHLVGVTHTEEEAKAEAAEVMVQDEDPDEFGEPVMRPGKLTDYFPNPYKNEQAARHANNGALPPDLSYIVLARHGGEDYIFSLLTGYTDPPAGVTLAEGQQYNPYFPGGAIGMAQSIYNETVEFEDGTPASAAQIAKDVTTFLAWASSPELDERRRLTTRIIPIMILLTGLSIYWKRWIWAPLKMKKVTFYPKER